MENSLLPQASGVNSLGISPEAVHNAIVGQESGWNPNVGLSAKGAHGIGQIMPETFKQYAREGESLDSPADNLSVSRRIIDDYYKRFGGDPKRVAVAYFSGPGNVAPEGSATPWKRDASDGRVKVSQYVDQVAGRIGHGESSPKQAPVSVQAPSPMTDETSGIAQQQQLLALLSVLMPKHQFTPIDYDPFAVIGEKKGT
jgi:hypothetical protein